MQKDERVQVTLQSGVMRLVAWLDKHVKVGNTVTLKDAEDPTRVWEVLAVSEPKKASTINQARDYRVGGLTG